MTKDKIEILDYFFDDGYLIIDFSLNNEEGYRNLSISEDDFIDYIEDSGELEMFSDEWDYATESHYTRHWNISYDEYVSEYLDSDIINEFMIYYFRNNDYPELIEE
jgi:hypothetical protein